jgi:hypothetical protein
MNLVTFIDPNSVADPVPFWPLAPGSGMGKNQDQDPGSGSGMNTLDHISESLETIFCVKILKFFDANADADPESGNLLTLDPDPGWKKFGSEIRDKHPGSATMFVNFSKFVSYNLGGRSGFTEPGPTRSPAHTWVGNLVKSLSSAGRLSA